MERSSRFGFRRILALVGYLAATASMYVGFAMTLMPAASKQEDRILTAIFFAAWVGSLLLFAAIRHLNVKARKVFGDEHPKEIRWTDCIIALQSCVCIYYLIWGIGSLASLGRQG